MRPDLGHNSALRQRPGDLAGIKGHVTDLQACPNGERSLRMSKSDLRARPIYHRKRDSIEAHLTIVSAALAVTTRSGQSSRGRGFCAAQHCDLMSQHQQLDVLGGLRAARQDKPAGEPNEDEIHQPKGHGRSSWPTAAAGTLPQLGGQADFWQPAGVVAELPGPGPVAVVGVPARH